MHKLVMRFLTSTEGKYFTFSVDDIKADAKIVTTDTSTVDIEEILDIEDLVDVERLLN